MLALQTAMYALLKTNAKLHVKMDGDYLDNKKTNNYVSYAQVIAQLAQLMPNKLLLALNALVEAI